MHKQVEVVLPGGKLELIDVYKLGVIEEDEMLKHIHNYE
jgi:hypothetical protein